ncbi:hypothetical protein CRE_26739 [Caenorhabditis remanei]|uniref:Uncharacterized protein n=1 Tax=Caenorhabditis remanei TaxID=31234 RepID=E3MXS5_CAERE|nr:hypothetical protein CRE_26739 [Caenorhabditis remanei]
MSSSESEIEDVIRSDATTAGVAKAFNAVRAQTEKQYGIETKQLKPTDSLKVPEIECGRDYYEEALKLNQEVGSKYPSGSREQLEAVETAGEDTVASCFISTRTEINCKFKECEGSKRPKTLCICGPKKCKMGSDGLCDKEGSKDDEEDGSSSLFVLGTIINLTTFYLIASFF